MCSYNRRAIQLSMSFFCLMDVLGMQLGLVGTGQRKNQDGEKHIGGNPEYLKSNFVPGVLSLMTLGKYPGYGWSCVF